MANIHITAKMVLNKLTQLQKQQILGLSTTRRGTQRQSCVVIVRYCHGCTLYEYRVKSGR